MPTNLDKASLFSTIYHGKAIRWKEVLKECQEKLIDRSEKDIFGIAIQIYYTMISDSASHWKDPFIGILHTSLQVKALHFKLDVDKANRIKPTTIKMILDEYDEFFKGV